MNIYPSVNFMWKWARPNKGFFSSLYTTVIIVMYAIFKINHIVSECACVFYNAHPTYLFYTSQPSNNPYRSKYWSWESNFSFLNEWDLVLSKSSSLLLRVRKKNIHEYTNTFETGRLLHYVNSKFKCILRDCIFVFL